MKIVMPRGRFAILMAGIVAAVLAAIAHVEVDAQGRGGRGGPQTVPTEEQWVASVEAQRRVAVATRAGRL